MMMMRRGLRFPTTRDDQAVFLNTLRKPGCYGQTTVHADCLRPLVSEFESVFSTPSNSRRKSAREGHPSACLTNVADAKHFSDAASAQWW